MILKRLEENVTIESHKSHNKLFRFINASIRLIDFKNATKRTPLALKYPFHIEDYFNTYPGNIIIVAGAADAGKTGFLLNLIHDNMEGFPVYYQSSEMGKEELASRLELFEGIDLQDWNFVAEERSFNFADAIRPDCINIIDYMEFPGGDYTLAADYLRAIFDKLRSGIAIIAIQMNRGAELGQGGNKTLEKPRLYLTMDAGRIKIQKCKNWADFQVNPNGLILNYKVIKGCKFITTNDWHEE